MCVKSCLNHTFPYSVWALMRLRKTAHVRDILGIRDTWINFRDMGIQCFLKGYICRIFWGYGIFFKIIIGIWDTGAPFQGLLINLLPFNPSWPCQRVSSLQYLGMLSGISSGSALNFKDRNYTSRLYKTIHGRIQRG